MTIAPSDLLHLLPTGALWLAAAITFFSNIGGVSVTIATSCIIVLFVASVMFYDQWTYWRKYSSEHMDHKTANTKFVIVLCLLLLMAVAYFGLLSFGPGNEVAEAWILITIVYIIVWLIALHKARTSPTREAIPDEPTALDHFDDTRDDLDNLNPLDSDISADLGKLGDMESIEPFHDEDGDSFGGDPFDTEDIQPFTNSDNALDDPLDL